MKIKLQNLSKQTNELWEQKKSKTSHQPDPLIDALDRATKD